MCCLSKAIILLWAMNSSFEMHNIAIIFLVLIKIVCTEDVQFKEMVKQRNALSHVKWDK